MTDSKGWFSKFVTAFSRPKIGQVFVNKNSENLNIFFGRKGLFGRILLWSPRNKARWVSSKWFKRHRRVLWPDKEIVCVDIDRKMITNMDYHERMDYLNQEKVKEELTEQIRRLDDEKRDLYLNYPPDFMAFCVFLIFAMFGLIFFSTQIGRLFF